jgi:hypothetical protein
MQERYRDEETKETTVERTKYFDELFRAYTKPGIQMDEYRQSFMITVPEISKYGNSKSSKTEQKVFFINNKDSGSLVVVPAGAVIRRDTVKPAEGLEELLKDQVVKEILGRQVEKALETYLKGLESIAGMSQNQYKKKFNLEGSQANNKYLDNTAYINPRKLRNICERGTVGNLCYSYNYATGQIGFHTYRGDKWKWDRAVDKDKNTDKRIEKFKEERPLNNENNLLTAQIIDRVMENAQRRLLAGEVSREDMEKITNSATGMPTVYMGTALLECPKEKEEEYRKYEEQYEKNPESVDVKKLFYDIHDFFESDEEARNFFSFEDCGNREKSSFGEKVAAFRRESENKPVEREETDRFTSEKLDYVTGPCDYYSNIQRWNNNEGNVINSAFGLLVGDIDAINTKIEGDKLLISVHEGKSAIEEKNFKFAGRINDASINMPQDIFYRIFINMIRIGTEGDGLWIPIGDKRYKVELDDRYNKIYGVSKCIIDAPLSNTDKLKVELGYISKTLPVAEKDFSSISQYIKRETRKSIYGGSANDREFHRELKGLLKLKAGEEDLESHFCLCSTDKHVLPGLDAFYHCREHGVKEGTDDGAEPVAYELKNSLFVQEKGWDGKIQRKTNDTGTQLLNSRGYLPWKNTDFKKWQKNVVKSLENCFVSAENTESATEATKVLAAEFYGQFYDTFAINSRKKTAAAQAAATRNEIAQKREQVKATTATAG